jgi:ArsR family transcriptional regulator
MATERHDPTLFFAALADPTRLRLVQILARQPDDGPLCVGALAVRLGVSQPAVSQHLRVLRNLGLVQADRRGVRVHYFLDVSRFLEWRHLVEETLKLARGED